MNEHLLAINMKLNSGEVVGKINNVESSVVNMIKQVQNLQQVFDKVQINDKNQKLVDNLKNSFDSIKAKVSSFHIGMVGLNEAFNDAAEGAQQIAVLEQFDKYSKIIKSFNSEVSGMSDELSELGLTNLSGELQTAISSTNKMVDEFQKVSASAREIYLSSQSTAENVAKLAQDANIISPDQSKIVAELDIALSSAAKRIGQVSNKNAEYVALQKKSLELAMEHAKGLEHLPDVQGKISRGAAIIEALDKNIFLYKKNALDIIGSQAKLIETIVESDINRLKLTKNQADSFNKLLPVIKAMVDLSEDGAKSIGITNEQYKKILEFGEKFKSDSEDIIREHLKWQDIVQGIEQSFKNIDLVVPGFADFAQVLHPLRMIGQELRNINSLYERNSTVNAVFMKDMYDSYNATAAMAQASFNASEGVVLLQESQAALSSILNSGQAAAVANKQEMDSLVESVAIMSRITGTSSEELANLQTRLLGLSGSIDEVNKLSNVFVNVQASGRLSTSQMQQMVGLLTRDLNRLDRAYQIIDASGNRIMSGTAAIAAGMGTMAEEAAKAGGSSQAALDILTRAIQDPISQAALLGPALMESDPSKQFLMMGERAHMFLEQMESMPPAIQTAFAQRLGTTPQELDSLSKATRDYREALAGATTEAQRQAITEKFAAEHRKKAADETKAAELQQEAYDSATRNLSNALNSIILIFGRLAAALQPVLDVIAAIMSNPIGRWLLIAAGAALTLGTVITKLVKGFAVLRTVFGGVGKAAGDMVASTKGKDGGGFIEWIKNFITKLGEIPIVTALKAAATLVLVGAALAAGIAMMGLALNLMPPGKALELAITVGGIVAAAYVVTLMAPIIKPALIGALGLIAVGAALAIGIAMIGLASNLLDPKQTSVLLVTIGGLLAAMGVCAAIGFLIVPALIGALGMIAVAGALATSIWIISRFEGSAKKAANSISILADAVSKVSIGSAVSLGILAGSLASFAITLTGAAIVGIFTDFTKTARRFADSLDILISPLNRLSGMGNAANVLVRLSRGLAEFGSSLNYGGWFSSIPDFVEVANRLASAIGRLMNPVSQLGDVGIGIGSILYNMGMGLSQVADALTVKGWSTPDFAENAGALSRSLSLLLGPVRGFNQIGENAADVIYAVASSVNTLSIALSRRINSRNIDTLSRAVREITNPLASQFARTAEEIQSSLSVEMESSISKKEDIIIERLEEIRDAINEQETSTSVEELKLMNKTLKGIASEMSLTAMMSTSADTRYNV